MLNKGKTIGLFIASCRGRQVLVPFFYSHYLCLCSRQPDLSWTESRAWTPSPGSIRSQRTVSGEGWTKDITKEHFSKGIQLVKSRGQMSGSGTCHRPVCPGSERWSEETDAQKTLSALVPGCFPRTEEGEPILCF